MWPGYHELVQDLLHNVSEEVYEWDTNGYYYVYVDFRNTGASEDDLKHLANHYRLQVHLTHDPGSGPQNLLSRRGRTRRANSAFFYPRQGQFDYWKNLSYTILDPKRAQRDRDDYYSGRWTTYRRNPDKVEDQLDVNGHRDYGFSKLNISIGPGWDDEWMLDIYGDQESGLKLFFDDLDQLRDFNQRLGKHIDDAITRLGN